jgi:hypothetical protein
VRDGTGRGRKRGSQTQTTTQGTGEEGDLEGEGVAAAKEPAKRRRGNLVDDQFRVSSKAVEQHGRIFEGQTYCVLESEFAHTPAAGMLRKFSRDDVSVSCVVLCEVRSGDANIMLRTSSVTFVQFNLPRTFVGSANVIFLSTLLPCS